MEESEERNVRSVQMQHAQQPEFQPFSPITNSHDFLTEGHRYSSG